MSKVTTGQTGAIEQPREWDWSPLAGYTSRRSYEGTSASALATLEAELKAGGWSYSVKNTPGKWTLSATIGGDNGNNGGGNNPLEPLADVWEMSANVIEKDLLESDISIMDISSADLKTIKDWQGGAISRPTLSGNAGSIVVLLDNNVKSVRVFQPTLRHTKIVSSSYAIKQSYTNIGKIISTSSIGSLEGVPNTLIFSLPPPSTSKRTGAAGLELKYGWYKKPPTVLEQAGGNWQIVLEYEWGWWSTLIYGQPI